MTENIWNKVISKPYLRMAFDKVHANGGTAGGDGITSDIYARDLNKNLQKLSEKLSRGEHEFGECRQLLIPKRKGGIRRLMIPTIEDRIIHTSLAFALSPILEPLFEECSFAYRPGRSVQQAVQSIEKWRNEGYKHVIEADINSYFDAVRHDLLLKTLQRALSPYSGSRRILEYLKSDFTEQGKQLTGKPHGLVQGSPLSPLMANLYLDVLDEKMSGKGVSIVRFADDFVILCKTLKKADGIFEDLKVFLATLGLTLNVNKTRIVDFDKGFEFLGYLFVRSLAMRKSDEGSGKAQLSVRIESTDKVAPHHSSFQKIHTSLTIAENTTKSRHSTGDRVLYVLEKNRRIYASHNQIYVVTEQNNEVLAVPSRIVDGIVVGPHIDFERSFLDDCLANTIQLTIIDGRGQLKGRLCGPEDNKSELQFKQAIAVNDAQMSVELSKKVIDARIRNQRTQLFRLNRNAQREKIHDILKRLKIYLRKIHFASSVNELRGLEGVSASLYWPGLALLCKQHDAKFKRTRPAKDPLNASINYLTAMLERDVRSGIRAAQLHCGFGFLHRPRENSEAAVYDLMEPFRAPLNEGLAVFLFNARRLKQEMFTKHGNSIRMDNNARRAVITGYEQAVSRRVNIPGKARKLVWREMMKYQAVTLAKTYRTGNLDDFQPYIMEA